MNKLLAKAKIMKEKPLQLEDYTTKWTYWVYQQWRKSPTISYQFNKLEWDRGLKTSLTLAWENAKTT